MRGYAELEVFSPQELEARDFAELFVSRAPAKLRGEWVRCHELVRAVGELLELPAERVADGYCGLTEHSWLWMGKRERYKPPPNILDVYAVGRLPQVQLVYPRAPFDYRLGLIVPIRRAVVRELVERMRSK